MNNRFLLPLIISSGMFIATVFLAIIHSPQPSSRLAPSESSSYINPTSPQILPRSRTDAPPPAEPVVTERQSHADTLLELVNQQRAERKLPLLKSLPKLNESSQLKATDMLKRRYFEHNDPDGRQGYDLIDDVGQSCGGRGEVLFDNSEWEESILTDAVRGWMNSPPHRKILLSTGYNAVGFGVSERYVVGHFCNAPDNQTATIASP